MEKKSEKLIFLLTITALILQTIVLAWNIRDFIQKCVDLKINKLESDDCFCDCDEE